MNTLWNQFWLLYIIIFFSKEKTDTDTTQRYGNMSEFVPNYADISSQTWCWFKRNRSVLALLSVGAFQRRHDPHRRVQYEEGYERKCHHQGIIPVAGCEMNLECCSVKGSNTSVTKICRENHFVVLFLNFRSGISEGSRGSGACGSATVGEWTQSCEHSSFNQISCTWNAFYFQQTHARRCSFQLYGGCSRSRESGGI